jgi:hypothetical protein
MSHRQHQAGCPPTVQRDSGRSPRCRQSSTVSRWTPSRSLISANPTGSCFLCWSAIEQLGQVVVPEQSERAAAHVMQVTRLGVPGGTSSGGSPQTRRRCSGEKPCSKFRRTVPWSAGMRARRPSADGDASASPTRDRHTRRTGTALAPSATRMRVTPHGRRAVYSVACGHPRRERRSPGTAPPGDRRVRGLPEPPPGHSPRGVT